MKNTSLLFILLLLGMAGICQTSPANFSPLQNPNPVRSSQTLGDTIGFTPYPTGTVITTQYLNEGVLFSGFGGSGAPRIHDYVSAPSYGRTLTSENWFYALKVSFVDSLDTSRYHPARRIEFDNVVGYNGEVDYIHIDVYDTNDVVIHSYTSVSPEHVVLDFPSPVVAYITVDDSAATAYALDNFLIDFTPLVALSPGEGTGETRVFPNPSTGLVNIHSAQMIDEIMVFNTVGQRVSQFFPSDTWVQIELDEPGIYFAVVKSKGIAKTYKFLVSPE